MLDVIKQAGGATIQVPNSQTNWLNHHTFIDLSEEDIIELLEQLHDKYPDLVHDVNRSTLPTRTERVLVPILASCICRETGMCICLDTHDCYTDYHKGCVCTGAGECLTLNRARCI